MDKLWHTTNIYLHPQVHDFAEKLTAKMPGNLKVCKVLVVYIRDIDNSLACYICDIYWISLNY